MQLTTFARRHWLTLLMTFGGVSTLAADPAEQAVTPAPTPAPLRHLADGPGKQLHHWTCHASAGMEAYGTAPLSGDTATITGTIQFDATHTEHARLALAKVLFLADNEKDKSAGFLAALEANAPHTFEFFVVNTEYNERFAILSATQAPIPFKVTLLRPGRMKVTVAGVTKELAVSPLPTARLRMACESADVVFADLTYGP